MAVQLGVAYSNVFQIGFGVFAGGPFDCVRNQVYTMCMDNLNPSIVQVTVNMKAWSGNRIASTNSLTARKIYMEVSDP